MNIKTNSRPDNSIIRTAYRLVLCLMIAAAMMLPAALPQEVYAAQGSSSEQAAAASQTDAEKQVLTSKTQNISGITLVFSQKVLNDERFHSAPGSLLAKGSRKSISLAWTAADNDSGLDGYIILRKDTAAATWKQIGSVECNALSYVDEEACDPDVLYSYIVVAYGEKNGKTMVSVPSDWAAAVTTRSSSKNVYECKVSNLANVVSVMAGSCAQPYLTCPDKAYSTDMRWSSSNTSVATVDEAGLITGVSPGTATIYAKSHTGSVTSFDVHITKPGSAQAMIDTFSAWMGYNRINGYQNGIIDIYNSVTPWPAGYKMRYSDAWCDATVTAAAIKTGNVDKIGRECNVPRHIKIFQQLGIWEEDGTITPSPGDIIVYSWRRFRQPNNASASHIGLVVKVENGQITCIEGNRGLGVVDTRTIPVGWGCIRGYARPHYEN